MPSDVPQQFERLRARRAPWLLVVLMGGMLVVGIAFGKDLFGSLAEKPREFLLRFRKLVPAHVTAKLPVLKAEQLTSALRSKGYHECNPYDPIGLGPYDAYRNVRVRGRMLIPQVGGYTKDKGFDVLIHFHGHEPVRKTLVQVTRGISFVGIDLGTLSGPYMKAFQTPGTFSVLKESIEQALRDKTGDERAHIRHLGLSAWSAGYGAVNEILKESDPGVDGVVLLDGLHAGYDPSVGAAPGHDRPLSAANISPILEFARKAKRGEKIFIFTHSHVDPVTYPSTTKTADLMLEELGLKRHAVELSNAPFPLTGRADKNGFHLWSYKGGDTKAHCQHIQFIAPAVRDILEPRWDTPPMDRNVPFTKAPKLGVAKPAVDPKPAPDSETGPDDKPKAKLSAAVAGELGAESGG